MIAVDLGSNTLRAIIYDRQKDTFKTPFQRVVKTADGLIHTGMISQDAVIRIIHALHEAQALFDFKTTPYCAVTTAAMRMAHNRNEVLKTILDATGISFRVIDAMQEAYYTQKAVLHRLQALGRPHDGVAIIDVGGASTELMIVGRNAISVDIGIVTLAQMDATLQKAHLKQMFGCLADAVKQSQPTILIATSGTPTTIAALKQGVTYDAYDPRKINGTTLSAQELKEALQTLNEMHEADRITAVGVGRSDLIEAGVEILLVLLEMLGFSSMTVIDDSLREGLALEGC